MRRKEIGGAKIFVSEGTIVDGFKHVHICSNAQESVELLYVCFHVLVYFLCGDTDRQCVDCSSTTVSWFTRATIKALPNLCNSSSLQLPRRLQIVNGLMSLISPISTELAWFKVTIKWFMSIHCIDYLIIIVLSTG